MTWPDLTPAVPALSGTAPGRHAARAAARAVLAGTLIRGIVVLGLVFLGTLVLGGCRRGPEGFELRPLVAAGRFTVDAARTAGADAASGSGGDDQAAGLHFAMRPALAVLEIDHERRPVVLASAASWSWTGRVPRRAALHVGLQLAPGAWRRVRRLQAVVVLRDGRDREVLQVVRSAERANPAWIDLSADLDRYSGRWVTLDFSVALAGLPPGLQGANLVAWGPVAVTAAGAGGAERNGRRFAAAAPPAGTLPATAQSAAAPSAAAQSAAAQSAAAQSAAAQSAAAQSAAAPSAAAPSAAAPSAAAQSAAAPSAAGKSAAAPPAAIQPTAAQPAAVHPASPVALPATAAGGSPRPNVIVILVDTLRRDRLTPYGYRRETSPEIGRRLAAAGTVVEDAYSQAPWTLPSVVSLMTGRYPGEMLGSDMSAYGIPAGIAPIAERLAAAGYETAGFLANPTLHVGEGFERGFDTFYAPPADVEWLRRHADDLNRHVLPWLAAYQDQDRPFFLYLHYIDPHDPYENPETAGNRSPFEGEYRGPVAGDWVHGFYTGKLVPTDLARDLAHLSALYDSEVHYVDRAIGQVLAALRPEVLAHTLVLLTADHGEELQDHGGWKHGQTLYEEQVHVPLIVRWDGHVPAGRRLAGTVRLLDVAPTLAAAAGTPPDPGWEGLDLLPALTGAAPLAERPAFAEGLSGGPLRAAAVLGRWKLVEFNRAEPFAPSDELQGYLWHKDLSRLARVELYDLAHDPGERHNLAPADAGAPGAGAAARAGAAAPPAAGAAGTSGLSPAGASGHPPTAGASGLSPAAASGLSPAGASGLSPTGTSGLSPAAAERLPLLAMVIERRLDSALPGLRVLASGVPAGSRLRLELTLARPPRRWHPYLLAPADRATLDGSRLTLEIAGGALLARGVTIEGDPGAAPAASPAPAAGGASGAGAVVQSLSAALDGLPLPPSRVRVGAGAAYDGGPLPLAALRTRRWPGAPPVAAGPVVQVWVHDASGEPSRREEHDAETERRLRALGYIE